MSAYQNDYGFENTATEILRGLDVNIDYNDYDSDNGRIIDCITFTVYFDNAANQFWYGCTATWYQNDGFSADNMKLTTTEAAL